MSTGTINSVCEVKGAPLQTSTPQKPTENAIRQEKANAAGQMDFLTESTRLVELNDRFASYIDRVWQLENDNNRLEQEVNTLKSLNDSRNGEIVNVRNLVDKETAELRKLVDDAHLQKSEVELDLNRVWIEKEGVLANLEEVKAEVKRISKKYDKTNKSLEKITLERVSLENKNKTLQEELHFLNSIFNQSQDSPRKNFNEIQDELSRKYEAKLQTSLKDLRLRLDNKYKANHSESTAALNSRIKHLEQGLQEAEKIVIKSDQRGKATVDNLNLKIDQLEQQLDAEIKSHRQDNENASNEIIRITKDLQLQHQNYSQLLEQKMALDKELVAYEQLLHGEETRFNLTTNESSNGKRKLLMNRAPTPNRLGLMEKRRRISTDTPQDFTLPPIFDHPEIKVSCPNPSSGMVLVQNVGKNSVNLGQWKITQLDEKKGVISYQFDKNFILEKGARTAVFSSNMKGSNTPKKLTKEIFLINANWSDCKQSTFVLDNNFGKQVSAFTCCSESEESKTNSSCKIM